MFCKKVFLEISKNSQKSNCASLFFNKVADLRPATLLKKRLWHRCFPVNFVKFLRTPFFIEHLWRLLSQFIYLRSRVKFIIFQLIKIVPVVLLTVATKMIVFFLHSTFGFLFVSAGIKGQH